MLGAKVRGYSLAPNSEVDLFNLLDGYYLCDSIIGDIRNRNNVIDAVNSFNPDFVFHLAAQPLVRQSYEIPSETFEVNAIGTANILDAIRLLEKKCQIILITTDKVYHNNEWEYPYRENDRLGGYDPYSASKACAELVIDSYRNSFFNIKDYSKHQKSIAVARAGNVIGGGDWAKDRLLPDIAKSLGNNETIIVRNPKAVRPWQHVLEPLSGYLQLGIAQEKDPVQFSNAFNFGPYANDALPVKKMVEIAIKVWGEGQYEIVKMNEQPHEAGLLKLDISKTVRLLGWGPRLNTEIAVDITIEWYKKYFQNKEIISAFTEQQIKNFFFI
jgi:CDP-glucose 4,6-dehydratase